MPGQTLLKIALTHHLAFDYRAANEAFREAFARPAPRPRGLEPSERITWAMPAAWPARRSHRAQPAATSRAEVAINLFRGLVAIGRDFDIEPDLAERFTVSDDGRSYRFTLRPTPAGATARRSPRTTSRSPSPRWPRTRWPPRYWLDGVSASALDERTLEIRLASRETTSCTCSASRRSSPGRGTSTSARAGLAQGRPARRKRPVRPHRRRDRREPRRAGSRSTGANGTGRAETSAR